MSIPFSESLHRLRIEKGLSQRQLSDALHVDRSTIAKWEAGHRLPDAAMISRLSECLDVDVAGLLTASYQSIEKPKVIMVDDERIILAGGIPILEKAMPGAEIIGFTTPADALEYAKANRIALAFLDIEMGRISGLDVCRDFLALYPRTNVIFLTAYQEYSFDAWETEACGFMLKPLTVEAVHTRLTRLRYPVRGLDGGNAK